MKREMVREMKYDDFTHKDIHIDTYICYIMEI